MCYVKYSKSVFLRFRVSFAPVLCSFFTVRTFFLYQWTSLLFAGSLFGGHQESFHMAHLCLSYYGTYLFSRACLLFKHDIPILAEHMAPVTDNIFQYPLWLNGACDQIHANQMCGVHWGHLRRRLSLESLHPSHKLICQGAASTMGKRLACNQWNKETGGTASWVATWRWARLGFSMVNWFVNEK